MSRPASNAVQMLAYSIRKQLLGNGYCVKFVGHEEGNESMISVFEKVNKTMAVQVGLVGVESSDVRLWSPNGYITGKLEATRANEFTFMSVFDDYKQNLKGDTYGSGRLFCDIN